MTAHRLKCSHPISAVHFVRTWRERTCDGKPEWAPTASTTCCGCATSAPSTRRTWNAPLTSAPVGGSPAQPARSKIRSFWFAPEAPRADNGCAPAGDRPVTVKAKLRKIGGPLPRQSYLSSTTSRCSNFFPYGRERQHIVTFSQQVLTIDSSRRWAPTRLSEVW